MRDVGKVVTNHATGLEHPALSPLLVVRAASEPHAGGAARDVLLALAGAVGQGRLIAVGDSSIVMNTMLRFPGNRALALALVRYLVDDDVWGKREGRLFVLVNDFDATGTFGDASRSGGLVADARRGLVEALQTLRRDGLAPGATYLLALVFGLGVVGWTGLRVGRTHRPSPPRFARPLPVVAQGGIAGHAAVLGSPHASRTLGMLELKSALEEELATRLGLERAPPPTELVARVRERGLLGDAGARELGLLLRDLGRVEAQFAGIATSRAGGKELGRDEGAWRQRVSDARVLAVARRVRAVLDEAAADANARGKVERPP
ncbi:MAG: hypothetical protein JOZ69_19470 [Myxococcales bacterium]|nr:hypothetical protein [Myxococcales bacterium]